MAEQLHSEREFPGRRSGLGERIGAFDWASTEIGALSQWPQSLRSVLDIMLGSNQAMFMVLGPPRRLLYNGSAVALLGGRHPGALGQPLGEAWAELHSALDPVLARAYAGHTCSIDHVRVPHSVSGHRLEYSIALSPLRDDDGRVLGAFCACNEVAHRDAARSGLLDQIAQLAWMADGDGRIFWCNQRWCDYTGLSPEKTLNGAWRDVHHPDHVERVRETFMRAVANREPWEDTFPLRGQDGQYRWFLSRALPMPSDRGEAIRWIGTNTDVTEQRAHAERLTDAERQTSEFLAMLGHELRNPLAAVRSAAELVSLAEPHDHRLRRAWEVLERQSTHMTRLIDSLLEVSRIARGKVQLDPRTVDLGRILGDMLQDRAAQLGSSGLEVQAQLPDEPVWVSGDEVRLAQIFDNLLGNAIKFTEPPGRVTVTLQRDAGSAIVRVRDTGVGIRPEMLSRIFDLFHQETQVLSRAAGGLGLGLALVKGLAELHGGSVEAFSAGPGQGAEFVVRLPTTPAPVTATQAAPLPAARGSRILIIEDNSDAAEMLQFVLEIQGHEVLLAPSGPEALDVLRGTARRLGGRGIPVDVVLCDIGLPKMSGFEVAREIRADPSLRQLPLVALTGYGRSSDRRRTLEAGFDAHLTKPVEMNALDEVLVKLLTGSAESDQR